MFLRYDFCFCYISETFLGGAIRGGIGEEGVCEGINASWVTQIKIVCLYCQMFLIGRGKGCRDNLSDLDCLLRCEEVVGIECGTWKRGACSGVETGCVVNHEVVCMFEEGVLEWVWERCNCTRRS